jgi:spoIIIJ-associated protein
MEWVETTGRTVEEAKDAALDQLGVDEQDAEFEVLEEARVGLFGRLRSEARVRARVRPTTPRPKDDRRDRQRRRRSSAESSGRGRSEGDTASESATVSASDEASVGADRYDAEARPAPTVASGVTAAVVAPAGSAGGDQSRSASSRTRKRRPPTASRPAQASREGGPGDRSSGRQPSDHEKSGDQGMDVALEDQAEVAKAFLAGLVDAMQLEAEIAVSAVQDETIELALAGADLGMLIGPKGATLLALQDLTRTVVQRKTSASNGRLFVDVQGYRQKRKVALESFARRLADEVRGSGDRKVLEPMSAADRKVVHDTIGTIDGVATLSEGEDPRRYIVIYPSDD